MDNKLSKYILKYSDKNDGNLKYDFMPSLLEIIERPSHIAGKVIIITTVLLFFFILLWASFSKLDIVITGIGNIIPEGNIDEVQSVASGRIKNIYVKEGDFVNVGDEIILLDTDLAATDVESMQYNIEWLNIQKEIYQLLLNDDQSIINTNQYDEKYINGIQYIIDEAQIYKLQKKQYEDYDDSWTEQYELMFQIKELQRQAQIHQYLSEIDKALETCESELKKYQYNLEHLTIRAPTNGYITRLEVNNIGQTVNAAQIVASIIPQEANLEFECFISDKDRADITVGKEVAIKLYAYPFSDYGLIAGKVSYISPSAFVHETMGNVYVINVTIDDSYSDRIILVPGLSGTVEIILGKRSVLDYFMQPILEGLNSSLKER